MINQKYLPLISDEATLRSYFESIKTTGYVVLPNFLEPAFVAEVKSFAEQTKKGDVMSSKEDDGTPMMRLARSTEFMQLFSALYRMKQEWLSKPVEALDPAQQRVGLPYKDATGGAKTKRTEFHYDAAYVNSTIGIIEPPAGQGDLHMFPNFKLKFKNDLARKVVSRFLRHSRRLRTWYGFTSVPSKENALCLFFGDLSFHGVEPITSGRRMIITINNHW